MIQQWPFTLRDSRTGQEYPVTPGGLRVGRTSQNEVVLDDENVSRHHATLWAQAGQLYVRDEKSTNGTWVNDERITAPRVLKAGDRVRIGDTLFEVAMGAAPPVVAEAAVPPRRVSPIVPIAIAGGTVLVILVALMFGRDGGGGGQGILPTLTPTPTPTPTLTLTATLAPTDTPTPVSTGTPTQPPARTPTPQAVPPELVLPAQGGSYGSPVTFQWNGSLKAGQAYRVTLHHPGSGHVIESGLLTNQEWSSDLPAEHVGEWRWTVAVVEGGTAVVTSSEGMFWFQPFPGSAPQPTSQPTSQPTATPTATPGFRA